MIKVNELRIGNYVLDQFGVIRTIETIGANESIRVFSEIYKCESMSLQYCNPIPLTEEMLLKCGFTRFGKLLRLNTFEYWTLSKSLVIHGHGGYYTGLILKIQYLHQLQNLYFALTGEEITVKL